jgi:hypothetical protein
VTAAPHVIFSGSGLYDDRNLAFTSFSKSTILCSA